MIACCICCVVVLLIASLCYTGCQKELPGWRYSQRNFKKIHQEFALTKLCARNILNGIVPGLDTAYVEVKVTLPSPANIPFPQNEQNGLSFSGSGVL